MDLPDKIAILLRGSSLLLADPNENAATFEMASQIAM